MSIRLELANAILTSPVTVNGRTLTEEEKVLISTALKAGTVHNEMTSASIGEHAGRLVATSSWKTWARWYGSDEKAWDMIQSIAGSALSQVKDKQP